MARFLAIEWNDTEARLAVAGTRGRQVVFEQAFSVSLQSSDPRTEAREVDVGQRIAAAMAARNLGRIHALVTVGRTAVELRQLSLPPAPDDELPELVRFQALREFATLKDDWALDFFPIGETADQQQSVLAAAISPRQVEEIQETCRAAGLKPRKMVLRSCSAASLLCRTKAADEPGQVRLLIDLLGDEADLTVIVGGTTILLRCARLPDDPLDSAESAETLLSEIRRTMAAAHNQLAGRRVESLVLCGISAEHDALARQIGEQFSLSVEQFDPFEGLKLKGDLRRRLPKRPDRFAPLLGALLDELEKTGHAVDFLHPRRRPEAIARRNTAVSAALIAATLVLAWIGFNAISTRSLQNEVRQLQNRLTTLEKEAKTAVVAEKAAKEVGQWTEQNVVWLDELRWLAEKAPGAEDIVLTQLNLSPGSSGGQMKLKGFAKSVEAIAQLEDTLRDKTHQVRGGSKSEDRSAERYELRFDSAIFVTGGDR